MTIPDSAAPTLPLVPPGPASAPAADTAPATRRGPRVRWAGIVWGTAFAALAGTGFWLASTTDRTEDLGVWAVELPPATAITGAVIVIGAVVLLIGLVGVLRRAQRAVGDRRARTAVTAPADDAAAPAHDDDAVAGVVDPQ